MGDIGGKELEDDYRENGPMHRQMGARMFQHTDANSYLNDVQYRENGPVHRQMGARMFQHTLPVAPELSYLLDALRSTRRKAEERGSIDSVLPESKDYS